MGMLLIDPSAPPVSPISGTSSNLTSSRSANVTYNTTPSASSPGPKLWNMEMFGYLAGSLLFGTIIVPLIAGTLLRFVVKTYTHLVRWWHLTYGILWLVFLVCLYTFHNPVANILRIILDATLVAAVLYQTIFAYLKRKRRISWSMFLGAMLMALVLDYLTSIPLPGTVAWTVFVVVCLFKYVLGRHIRKLLGITDETQPAEPRRWGKAFNPNLQYVYDKEQKARLDGISNNPRSGVRRYSSISSLRVPLP